MAMGIVIAMAMAMAMARGMAMAIMGMAMEDGDGDGDGDDDKCRMSSVKTSFDIGDGTITSEIMRSNVLLIPKSGLSLEVLQQNHPQSMPTKSLYWKYGMMMWGDSTIADDESNKGKQNRHES